MNNNLAFVFPGQGSQKIGMLADVADQFPVVKSTFAEASEVLGYDLWDRVQNGEQEQINMTECTQPLLLTASVAMWRVWNEKSDAQPVMMAGHSLGEWSALVCAGVVAFKDAVDIVRNRGAYMQEAVPAGIGAMAAIIGLDDDSIVAICETACGDDGVAVAVNFNTPGQVVIAGNKAPVERAMVGCKEAGAKRALPLPVSAPFHTPLMKPAEEKLSAQILATKFNTPTVPVVHNVNAKTESDPEAIKQLMIQQICSPVLWVDCVKTLVASGIEITVECGPGKVLSGMSKRIDRSLTGMATEDMANLEKTLVAF